LGAVLREATALGEQLMATARALQRKAG